jgi:hypothetical protein
MVYTTRPSLGYPESSVRLRLEGTHLGTQYRVFYSDHDTLLCVKAKHFSVTQEHKGLLFNIYYEVRKRDLNIRLIMI